MTYYEVLRRIDANWLLIRTHIETLETAQQLMAEHKAENPRFNYLIRRVEITDVEQS